MKKSRRKEKFGRPKAKKDVYEKVLIVCEGEKTEPLYLNDLLKEIDLPKSVDIAVVDDTSPQPEKVIGHAIEWLNAEENQGNLGEHKTSIFCVIDRDEHDHFYNALTRLEDVKKSGKIAEYIKSEKLKIKAISSFPCFEIWYLFHHVQTTKEYSRSRGKSPCERLITDLKKIDGFKQYSKSKQSYFKETYPMHKTAAKNAEFALKEAVSCGAKEPNPSTEMHELIFHLQDIKKTIDKQK